MSPALIQLRTVWSALTIGCLMYIVVARWVSPAASPRSAILPDPNDPIELGFAVAALATVAAGFVISKVAARTARARLGDGPASEDGLLRAALLPLAIRYALFESVAVMGFVQVFLGKPAAKVLPFVVLAVAALIVSFPTRERAARLLSDG